MMPHPCTHQPDDVAQYLFQLRRNDTYKGRAMPISAGTSLGYVMARTLYGLLPGRM